MAYLPTVLAGLLLLAVNVSAVFFSLFCINKCMERIVHLVSAWVRSVYTSTGQGVGVDWPLNITSELQPCPKGKAKQTAPNRNQTVRQASSALGWLSSHTRNFWRQGKVWAGAVETLVNLRLVKL